MSGEVVSLTAEWALKGRLRTGTETKLLACSQGVFSPVHFNQVLERYSPGTLQVLPQVTVDWMRNGNDGNHVGLACHQLPSADTDLDGDSPQTSYFSMAFPDLANTATSYTDLYLAARRVELGHESRRPVRLEIEATPRALPRRFAVLAAAWLLTDIPVCVLGADHLTADERLVLIDEIALLLPYGMRSRLSASTWTNSAYKNHRFRLFFSSVPRNASDLVLRFDQKIALGDNAPSMVRDYADWLDQDIDQRLDDLLEESGPIGFKPDEVGPVLQRLGVLAPRSRTRPERLEDEPSVERLLNDCAAYLKGGDAAEYVQARLASLRKVRDPEPDGGARRRYQEIITRKQLFRQDLPLEPDLAIEFYQTLLILAFGDRLSYGSLCEIERCLPGEGGRLPHLALAVAMRLVGLEGRDAELLTLLAIGEQQVWESLSRSPIVPRLCVKLATDAHRRPHHRRALCEIVVNYIAHRSVRLNVKGLKAELRRNGYLAPVLEDLYPEQLDRQFDLLCTLVKALFGPTLGGLDLQELLVTNQPRPTRALLEVAKELVSPEIDPLEASLAFSYGYLSTGAFNPALKNRYSLLIRRIDHEFADSAKPKNSYRAART